MQRAEIGKSIVVKGDITANEDLVISGRIEGSIAVNGHSVIVHSGAEVLADIQAHAVVIAGQVLGVLSAEEAIELQPSAQVEGEIVAPTLKLHEGAVFNGKAQTLKKAAKPGLQLAS